MELKLLHVGVSSSQSSSLFHSNFQHIELIEAR